MANASWSEITTTTIESRTGSLADNVIENNALWAKLNMRGNVKPFSGGDVILHELTYQENQTFKRFSGLEQLDTSASDVISSAEYAIKQAAVAVVISGLDQLKNSGPERQIDLIGARVDNAETTFANNMSGDAYSDGTADSSKQIGGIQHLIANDPTTGTVGGINRATYTFWRNQTYDASSDGGAATSSTNIKTYLNRLLVKCKQGKAGPDLCVQDNNHYEFLLSDAQGIQRINNGKLAELGFETIRYHGMDVVLDGGYGGDCPASTSYLIDTSGIMLRPHRDQNMVQLDPRDSINQHAVIRYIAWAGNMTAGKCLTSGILKE